MEIEPLKVGNIDFSEIFTIYIEIILFTLRIQMDFLCNVSLQYSRKNRSRRLSEAPSPRSDVFSTILGANHIYAIIFALKPVPAPNSQNRRNTYLFSVGIPDFACY